MTPLATRGRPALTQVRGSVLGAVVCFAIAVGAVAEVAPRLAVPDHVDRIRVVNPTPYQVNVDVRGGDGAGGWLDLGTIGRERTKTLQEVTDQGRRWVFHFSYGGFDAGEVSVARVELARAGWTLHVPAEVGAKLRDAGYQPSAL